MITALAVASTGAVAGAGAGAGEGDFASFKSITVGGIMKLGCELFSIFWGRWYQNKGKQRSSWV